MSRYVNELEKPNFLYLDMIQKVVNFLFFISQVSMQELVQMDLPWNKNWFEAQEGS